MNTATLANDPPKTRRPYSVAALALLADVPAAERDALCLDCGAPHDECECEDRGEPDEDTSETLGLVTR